MNKSSRACAKGEASSLNLRKMKRIGKILLMLHFLLVSPLTCDTFRTRQAEMTVFDHPYQELSLLRPLKVNAGYRFSFALTVDDLIPLN